MSARFCYWSIGTDRYCDLLEAMVASARAVGVAEDFHFWTNRDVPGAICHPAGTFDNWGWLFKIVFLHKEVARLNYDYFVFLDADNWFVRKPEVPEHLLDDTPFHVTLGANMSLVSPKARWWHYPVETHVSLMRAAGVRHRRVYNTNAGMFIARRDAIDTIYDRANRYWDLCREWGVLNVDEPILAYVAQILGTRTEGHTLADTHTFWATDGNGVFSKRLPDGNPFRFRGFFSQYDADLNPSIVHVVHGKGPMYELAHRFRTQSHESPVRPNASTQRTLQRAEAVCGRTFNGNTAISWSVPPSNPIC